MRFSEPIEIRRENAGWRIDPDGMMRITAYILKTGVFRYSAKGMPDEILEHVADRDNVQEFIDLSKVTPEVLATLEGKPVVAYEHEWQEVKDSENDLREFYEKGGKAKVVGTIAGTPEIVEADGGQYIKADIVINDADTIKAIQERDLIDTSASYMSNVRAEPGEHDGEKYDLTQDITRFNHVALLPFGKGRCGKDVKILNGKEEENGGKKMPFVIQRKIGNSEERFTFNSEEDAKTAEKMVAEIENVLNGRVREAEADATTSSEEAEMVKKANEELSGANSSLEAKIAEISAKLDRLLGLEEKEQAGDEEAIVAEELDNEDDKDAPAELMEEIKKENSLDARRKLVVAAVAKQNSLDISKWSADAVDAQFQMLAAKARKSAEVRLENAKQADRKAPARRDNSGEDRYEKRVRERNEFNRKQ